MKTVDAHEYISMLRELTEQGKEVSMIITGYSMSPFLSHGRDTICFQRPDRELRKGDMVFYQRTSGQFVMHRIQSVKPDGLYIVGDAQTEIEGPVKREQVFALITKVKRKGKWICSGNFWWDFFEYIWIRIIPLRPVIVSLYGKFSELKKQGGHEIGRE